MIVASSHRQVPDCLALNQTAQLTMPSSVLSGILLFIARQQASQELSGSDCVVGRAHFASITTGPLLVTC